MLKNYNHAYLYSKNLVLSKDQSFNKNFYVKYLTNDLKIKKLFKKNKEISLQKCRYFKIILGLIKKLLKGFILIYMVNTIDLDDN